jgi:ferredoxin--NADP+ reductase
MFPIVATKRLAADVCQIEIAAPRIAHKQRPGQFVIVRTHSRGERIPLTIAGASSDRGTITLVVQGVGKTTKLINSLGVGDAIRDVAGPLGQPSEIRLFGTVMAIAGGVGAAIILPVAQALRAAGNRVLGVLGARSRDLLVLESELRDACDELTVMTDDGSYGRHGLVVDPLLKTIADRQPLDRVLAVGPVRMMQAVAEATRGPGIPTIVSLNALMVDGTGMCGGCRVMTAGGARFACVDGPEFDAHEINFGILAQRNQAYRDREAEELREYTADPARWLEEVRAELRTLALAQDVSHYPSTAAADNADASSAAASAAATASAAASAAAAADAALDKQRAAERAVSECRLEAAHPELRS